MTKKIRIPFGTVSITEKAKRLVNEVLNSSRVSSGKYVREFEKRYAELIGTKEAVAVSSGTDADTLALAVLYDFGARRNDEIILPALSFVATGNAVLQAGFTPVFVDIDRRTLNIDPPQIEQAITEKTKAIMPVHLMGKPADMDTINNIAKRHNLFVIEDAAEAHGAIYKGKNVGSLGHMAAFSLYVAHMITTIEGGVVVTNNPEFAEILRSLRSHGRACKCESCVLNINSGYCHKRFQYDENTDIRFVFERIGYSCKMNEIEACIGLGNLDIYSEILKKRKHNLKYITERFRKFSPFLVSVEAGPDEEIGPHAFPIILQDGVNFSRNEFSNYLENHGVDTRTLFSSIPTQCPGFGFLGYKLGNFPNAEYIGNNAIHIGIHQDIEDEHIDYILDIIEKFVKKHT